MSSAWERLPDEPNAWFQKFEVYRLLGPKRSLLAAYKRWQREKSQSREKSRKVATKEPRTAPGTWRKSRDRWRWPERAEAWDQHLAGVAAAEVEAHRLEILTSGYAQQHERVQALNGLADLLLEEVYTEDKRWCPDVKQIGAGPLAERVDIVRFNAALVRELRETLADVAAEMGERVKGVEITTEASVVTRGQHVIEFDVSGLPVEILRALAYEGEPGLTDDSSEEAASRDGH